MQDHAGRVSVLQILIDGGGEGHQRKNMKRGRGDSDSWSKGIDVEDMDDTSKVLNSMG